MNPDPATLHRIRDLVGRSYDRDHGAHPERHQPDRTLTVTAIPGAYQYASHVVLAISGTPTRGLIIVALTHGRLGSRDLYTGRVLRQADHDAVMNFVADLARTLPHMVPVNFRWSSKEVTMST